MILKNTFTLTFLTLIFNVYLFAQRPQPIPLSIDMQIKGITVANDQMGLVVKTADFNGDGKKDLLVNSKLQHYYIYMAKSNGVFDTTAANQSLTTNFWGSNTITVGDFNNDGKDDLGFINLNTQGFTVLTIHDGTSTGILSAPSKEIVLSNQVDFVRTNVQLAPVSGDINGDGFDDVAIGSPNSPSQIDGSDDFGRMYFIYGSASGLNPSSITMFRDQKLGRSGSRMAFAGDVNKDGFDDILMTSFRVPFDENAVHLILGNAQGIRPTLLYFGNSNLVAIGDREDDDFAKNIGNAGDINGDGFDDVYVSDPNRNTYIQYLDDPDYRGRLVVFNGASTQPLDKGTLAWSRYPKENGAVFGSTMSSVGDFDDDGFTDIGLIDQRGVDFSLKHRLLIYRGGKDGIDSLPSFQFAMDNPTNATITKVGDMDGDGYHDFFIGEPTYGRFFSTSGGRVALIKGKSSMVPDFNINNNSVCVGNPIQFFDKSFVNIPHTRIWDFGDGTTDTARNPIHIFNQIGHKNITLTLIDSKGRKVSTIKKDFLTVRIPLSTGTYLVGPGEIIPDMKALTDALECGITGRVTIKIKDGTYTTPLKIQNFFPPDSLIIESASGDATKVVVNVVDTSALRIVNARNIVFRKITLGGYQRYTSREDQYKFIYKLIHLTQTHSVQFFECLFFKTEVSSYLSDYHYIDADSAHNLRIEACEMGDKIAGTNSVYPLNIRNSDGVVLKNISKISTTHYFNKIDSCKNVVLENIINLRFNVSNCQNVRLSNSKVGVCYFSNTSFLEVSKNEFLESREVGSVGNFQTLNLSRITGFKITKNLFKNKDNALQASVLTGISANNWNLIANNIMTSTNENFGLSNSNGSTQVYFDSLRNTKIYHNTFGLFFSTDRYLATALSINRSDSVDFRSNIVKCFKTPLSISASRFTADYNIYDGNEFTYGDKSFRYIDDPNSPINYQPNNTTYFRFNNFALIQEKTGLEAHSLWIPFTFGADTLTPSVSSAIFVKKAAPRLPEVVDDFYNAVRPNDVVDIGAFEITTPVEPYRDIAALKIVTTQLKLGQNTLTMKVVNLKKPALDSLFFYYQVNDGAIVKEKRVIPLQGFDSLNYTFTTPLNLTKGRACDVKCWVKLSEGVYPNFTLNNNDTVRGHYFLAMAGEYTVGSNNRDYKDIDEAVKNLIESGTAGDIVILADAGDYKAYMNREYNTKITHSVTIRGTNPDRNQVHLTVSKINFPEVVIENLTMHSGSPGSTGGSFYDGVYGTVIIGSNTTFRNCTFVSFSNPQYSFGGITVSKTKKVVVDNCIFKDKRGIQVSPFDLSNYSFFTEKLDTLIVKNTVFEGSNEGLTSTAFNFYRHGVDSLFVFQNNRFLKNELAVLYPRQCSLSVNIKSIVTNNDLNDASIAIIGNPSITNNNGLIANNVIKNGYITANGNCIVAHNTIYNGGVGGYFFNLENSFHKGNSKLINNCISYFKPLQSGPSGTQLEEVILVLNKERSSSFVSDNNLFYYHIPNGHLNGYYCQNYNAESFKESLDCLGTDQHSFVDNPRFISNTDLRPDTTQYTPLSNSGISIANIPELAFDITGRPRNVQNPDIGAYEVGGNNSGYVWPGDANNDGITNNIDLFTLGLAIPRNLTGMARTNASLEWKSQAASDWPNEISRKNAKYADCDGNGTINNNDATAVNLNFNKIHAAFRSETSSELQTRNSIDVPIYFSGLPDSYDEQAEVTAFINLGEVSKPLNDVYGVSFSFDLDTSMILNNSFSMQFDSCWLGKSNLNLLSNVSKTRMGSRIEIGIVRTDGKNISGFGKIAKFTFKLKGGRLGTLNLKISNTLTVNKDNVLTELRNDINKSIIVKNNALNISVAPNIEPTISAVVNKFIYKAIGIKVISAISGLPIKDIDVVFTLPDTGATALFNDLTTTTVVKTDINGIATAFLGSANKIAGRYQAKATVPSINKEIFFDIINQPDVPYQFIIMEGDNQTTHINTPFEKPIGAKLVDYYNNAIINETIKFFNHPLNNSDLSPNALWVDSSALRFRYAKTDAQGIARMTIKANNFLGSYKTVSCFIPGVVGYFNLANVDSTNTPTRISSIGSHTIAAIINSNYDSTIIVKLTDKQGRPSVDRPVKFIFPSSKDTLPGLSFNYDTATFAVIRTNTKGDAILNYYNVIANSRTGSFTIKATYNDQLSLNFTANNVSSFQSQTPVLQKKLGDNQSTMPNKLFAIPVKVVVESPLAPLVDSEVLFEFVSADTSVANGYWSDKTRTPKRLKTNAKGEAEIMVLANSKLGSFKVNAYCAIPNSRMNQTFTLINSNNVSAVSEIESEKWIISPNPSSGIINIENKQNGEIVEYCNVYDLAGILRGYFPNTNKLTFFTLDLNNLLNGAYFLDIQTKSNKIYKKVIIQK